MVKLHPGLLISSSSKEAKATEVGEGGNIYSNSHGHLLSFPTLSTGILTVSRLDGEWGGKEKKVKNELIFYYWSDLHVLPAANPGHRLFPFASGNNNSGEAGPVFAVVFAGVGKAGGSHLKASCKPFSSSPYPPFVVPKRMRAAPLDFFYPRFPLLLAPKTGRTLCVCRFSFPTFKVSSRVQTADNLLFWPRFQSFDQVESLKLSPANE